MNYRTAIKDCKGTKVTIYAESLEDMTYKEIAKKLEELKCVRTSEKKSLNPEINDLRNKLKSIELAEQYHVFHTTLRSLSIESEIYNPEYDIFNNTNN